MQIDTLRGGTLPYIACVCGVPEAELRAHLRRLHRAMTRAACAIGSKPPAPSPTLDGEPSKP